MKKILLTINKSLIFIKGIREIKKKVRILILFIFLDSDLVFILFFDSDAKEGIDVNFVSNGSIGQCWFCCGLYD